MDEAKRELVQAWLLKAQSDLLSARTLASASVQLLDTAIYHCQQSAEKAVKAILVFHDEPFDKTHDIGKVLRLAVAFEPRLTPMEDAADRLTRYAFIFRYPGARLLPTQPEFDQAFADAEAFYALAFEVLPTAAHP
jgi:HEPN domain-containing protein